MASEEVAHVPAGAFALEEPSDAVAHERWFGDTRVFAICLHEAIGECLRRSHCATSRVLDLIFGMAEACPLAYPQKRRVVVTENLRRTLLATAVVPPSVREVVPAVRVEQPAVRTVPEIATAPQEQEEPGETATNP